MIKAISIIFILNISLIGQTRGSKNILLSPENVKKFADYLFCQHDYLRSVEEYKRYLKSNGSDTVKFLIGEAYSGMGDFSAAAEYFKSVINSRGLIMQARLNYLKSLFQQGNFKFYRKAFGQVKISRNDNYFNNAISLYNFSFLLDNEALPKKKEFLKPFDNSEKSELDKFYDYKINPPFKSPLKAAILSAVIPGAGKFYTHEYADGIVAFLTTGILSYIAYTDFHADHKIRGWIFTALASGFYAGNIYGSAASAQIFNAKIRFDFTTELKNFLNKINYFVPLFNFCK